MRQWYPLFISLALLGTACSHESHHPDASPTATPSTSTETKASPSAKSDSAKKSSSDAQAAGDSAAKVECSVKGDERFIQVRDAGKGCELVYTKAGKEGVVASAGNSKEYCAHAKQRLISKLKGAGYECK